MQILMGALLGIGGLLLLAGLAYIIYLMTQLNTNLLKATAVFGKSAQTAEIQAAQVAVSRRLISSVEQMTAALKAFTTVVLRENPELPPAPLATSGYYPRAGRTPPPPAVPAWEEFASEGEADVIERTDEQLAEADGLAEARAQGLVPEDTPLPTPDKINFIQS